MRVPHRVHARSEVGVTAAAVLLATGLAAHGADKPIASLTPSERLAKNRAYMISAPHPDVDGDGRISQAEWVEKECAFLLSYDEDRDNRLTLKEYTLAFCIPPAIAQSEHSYRLCARSKKRDFFNVGLFSSGSFLTRDRYARIARQSFRRADRDRDGYLTNTTRP